MSLDWDVRNVKDYKTRCWVDGPQGTRQVHPTTEKMVWASIGVDIGKLTQKNADEFYIRYLMYSRAIQRDPQERWLTPADIHDHIGLVTNVRTTTDSQYTKKVGQILRDRAEQRLRYEQKAG